MNIDEFFAFVDSDPEHQYELIDGYPSMMTGGSPDHSIICNNIGRMLGNARAMYVLWNVAFDCENR